MQSRAARSADMPRSARRRWATILAGIVLVAGIGLPSADAAPAEAAEHASSGAGASVASPSDLPPGAGVTVAGRNDVAVDLLGLGYEQIVRLNGSRVEILEPATRGSGVLQSFEVGAFSAWPRQWSRVPIFYGGYNMADRVSGHSASRLAVAGEHIYVSNLRVSEPGTFMLRNPLGTVVSKYTAQGKLVDRRYEGDEFAVTSLDGFVWQGEEYLAIGFNQLGVRIVKADVRGMPDFHAVMWHYSGPHRFGSLPTNERDQITALEFGTDGSRLLLAVGVLTGDMPALLMIDAVSGAELWSKNLRPNDPAKFEWPDVITFGPFGGNGATQIAVGWPTLGHLDFMDAGDGAERGRITGGAVRAARFFTDASGEPRIGFRRDGSSHVAKPDPGGRPVVITEGAPGDLPWMVPGYRPWSLQVENRTRSEVNVLSFAGGSRAEGCWLRTALSGGAGPLPTQPVRIPASGTAGPFSTAHKLWGESCADNPGVFYLQVEPPGIPAERQLVQFHGDHTGVRVNEQVGAGRFAVSVEPSVDPTDRTGFRIVIGDRYAAPAFASAPVIDGARLTPEPDPGRVPTDNVNDPSRPVHRFTVSGVSWQVPGADVDLAETTLPLPVAEGSVDGETWDSLGTVASPLAPSRDGDRVTMGEALFDWQTAPGAAHDYRYIRVVAGGLASNVVDVAGLTAPAPAPIVKHLELSSPTSPRANGLDQTAVRISLMGDSSRSLDPAQYPEWYQRVFYRDPVSKALVTGLGDPANPSQLLMFSVQPGQYANDGLGMLTSSTTGTYFSMRAPGQPRAMTAVFLVDGKATTNSVLSRTSTNIIPLATELLGEGTGAGGLIVTPCAEGACRLADPAVAPAQHTLAATTIGIQLRAFAIPGPASLPLSQSNRPAEELLLRRESLTVYGSRATLANPNVFGTGAMISANLVTHGHRLTLENHYVK